MKKIYLLLALTFTIAHSNANVVRVNNTLGTDPSQKIFNSIQEAHDATIVNQGDTLMIEGTLSPYSNTIVTKRLVLLGPGYFLTQNNQTQANVLETILRTIEIRSSAGGTVLEGLSFQSGNSSYTVYANASNIIVRKCKLSTSIVVTETQTGMQLLNNYFSGNALDVQTTAVAISNATFKNNIVIAEFEIASYSFAPRTFSGVENNVFVGNIQVTTSTFRNNITTGEFANISVFSSNTENNIVRGTQLSGNGNQSYGTTAIFGDQTGRSSDERFRLPSNSAYKTAGYNNAEPGIFGGTTPYQLSGVPTLPSIYEFTADGSANKQAGLPITIKAKSN